MNEERPEVCTSENKRQRKLKGQSRDTGNIGYTGRKPKKKQNKTKQTKNKKQKTRTKTKNKTNTNRQNTTQKEKKMSNTDPTKNRG